MTGKLESWKSLAVSDDIVSVVQDKLGFDTVAEVQKRCIPQFLAHKDVIVQAPTGSGKTLAFVIPILEILRRREEWWKPWQVGALILVPNRELAFQIADTVQLFLDNASGGLKLIRFVGGTKLNADVEQFKRNGGNVVVATPGRLSDLINRSTDSSFNLSGHLKSLEVLILDEADRLLELGFHDSMQEILARLPKQRRTGLFSATQTDALDELAKTGLRNPVYITIYAAPSVESAVPMDDPRSLGTSKVPVTLKNYYAVIASEAKLTALRSFLQQHADEKILVFFSTCACVDYFGDLLKRLIQGKQRKKSESEGDGRILTLHGKKKRKRHQIFEHFRQRESGVLICTDVMARGIDIADIDWVIQFDPPRQATWFVHRCGRTARCGKSGNALLILAPSEEGYLEFLQRNQGVTLTNLAISYEDRQEWAMLEGIRKMASCSRELLEKGTTAFVSFMQAYSKHDCRIVCSLKEMDVVNVAHCFGLLRLPKMPELAGRDLSGFRKCAFNTSDVPYEDKEREERRLRRLDERRRGEKDNTTRPKRSRSQGAGSQMDGDADDDAAMSKKKRRRKEGKELKELDDDYRLLKKFKKGKVSKEQFDEHFLG